jgi:hypothetical protein
MTMKAIFPAVFALGLAFASGAQAQSAATTPAAPAVSGTNSATNGAVNTKPANNSGAPVAGANSFTEGQARDRIQDKGYTQVSDLKLDSQGVWRGKGTKNGASVDVSMDYQGNVVPQ